MKKSILFTIVFIVLGMAGCASAGTGVADGLEHLDEKNIKSITLEVDDKQSVKITEASSLERFVKAILTAEYTTSQLDIAAPDYKSTVEMKDGTSEGFSFWVVGGINGLFIKSGKNGHYRLPDDSKKELLNLFQSATS